MTRSNSEIEITTVDCKLHTQFSCLFSLVLILLVSGCGIPTRAPDFSLNTFSGEEFRLSELNKGESLVINFWYPSCPPCRNEMPHFQTVWERLNGQNIRFLGIFVPKGFDTESEAKEFVDELGLTFDFATDKGAEVAQEYGVEYFPNTFFINEDGRIVNQVIRNLDERDLVSIIEKHLID